MQIVTMVPGQGGRFQSDTYTLLSEIPELAKYFSVTDLKDAFYSVPLAEESQFLFAFEDSMQPASVNLDSFAPGISWQPSPIWAKFITEPAEL